MPSLPNIAGSRLACLRLGLGVDGTCVMVAGSTVGGGGGCEGFFFSNFKYIFPWDGTFNVPSPNNF